MDPWISYIIFAPDYETAYQEADSRGYERSEWFFALDPLRATKVFAKVSD